MGGQLVVPFTQKKPPFWVYNAGLNQLYLSTHHLSPSTAEFYIEKLHEFKPSHMIVYPSSAAMLAYAMLDLNLSPPPIKVIFSNAEPLSETQREKIGEAFGCRVVDTYGMGEYLVGASECVNGRMHLWPEVGYLEVLDDYADIPVSGDKSGRFVVTSLLNADMPLIRYDTGDRGRLACLDACDCGRKLPCIESIEGRSNDMLATRDGRQVFWINPVFYGLPIREAQVIQDSFEKVLIRYVPAPDFAEQHEEAMVERMQARLGNVSVVLDPVMKVPRQPNGKFRAVISLIKSQSTMD
jgi:phenylacetate-CoA ligase